jgi:hypothetical protein
MQKAETYPDNVSLADITQLCHSDDGRDRLLGLVLMRREIGRGDSASEYFEIAEGMVTDSHNTCRWQSIIVIGESIDDDPDRVWEVARRYGDSKDEDMRLAIAKVLLEHLLEADFDKYLANVKAEVSAGRLSFLDTLGRCGTFGDNSLEQSKKIDNYIRKATRGLPNREAI